MKKVRPSCSRRRPKNLRSLRRTSWATAFFRRRLSAEVGFISASLIPIDGQTSGNVVLYRRVVLQKIVDWGSYERFTMKHTHAVGIDLGTTYSNIAWLNEYGQPVTIPNQEGELSTPSVVFFDGEQPDRRDLKPCGTRSPVRSVSSSMSSASWAALDKYWKIDDTRYSPVHISGMILRKLIAAAQEQIGEITRSRHYRACSVQ
jgi:hypothetical protein